jgi:cytochrome P450
MNDQLAQAELPQVQAALPQADGFDFNNPAFRADPYPAYRFLREAAPVWRAPTGQWIVTSHALCTAILRDPQFGHANDGRITPEIEHEPVLRSLTQTMLLLDPPAHTRMRGLVAKAFTAKRMEALRPRIEAIVDALIDDVIGDGGMDVIADFAHKLPVTVICDMLGIPDSDRAPFLAESTVRGRILDPTPLSRQELDDANAGSEKNRAYFDGLFAYRRRNPGDDLTTALLNATEADDSLSDEEIVANIGLLFGAGHETTTNLIGNGVLALHRNPAQIDRLRQEPGLLPNAVEEVLRYDSPVQLTGRTALVDTQIGGERIAKGEEVITLLGAANHDPAAFAGDPDALDVARPGVRAISFGGGIHFCLGAQLARIEGEIAFRRLLERLPALRLVDTQDVAWKPTITLRGLKTLPARW